MFTEKPGLKITLDSKEQIDFLKLFLRQAYCFDDSENKSACSSWDKQASPLSKKFKIYQMEQSKFWGDKQDCLEFFLWGTVRLPTIDHYWSTDDLYSFSHCLWVMSQTISNDPFFLAFYQQWKWKMQQGTQLNCWITKWVSSMSLKKTDHNVLLRQTIFSAVYQE